MHVHMYTRTCTCKYMYAREFPIRIFTDHTLNNKDTHNQQFDILSLAQPTVALSAALRVQTKPLPIALFSNIFIIKKRESDKNVFRY